MSSPHLEITIRRFKRSDIKQVRQLSRDFGDKDLYGACDFSSLGCCINRECFIALSKKDNSILGLLVFTSRSSDYRILNFTIDDTSTHSEDATRKLLEFTEAWGRDLEDKIKSLSVVVRESDLAHQLFYKKLGFRCEKTKPNVFCCPPDVGYLFVKREI